MKLQGGMLRGGCFLHTAARCWAVHTGQRLQQREIQPSGTRYGTLPQVFLVRHTEKSLLAGVSPGWGPCLGQGFGKASDMLVEDPTCADPALLF